VNLNSSRDGVEDICVRRTLSTLITQLEMCSFILHVASVLSAWSRDLRHLDTRPTTLHAVWTASEWLYFVYYTNGFSSGV